MERNEINNAIDFFIDYQGRFKSLDLISTIDSQMYYKLCTLDNVRNWPTSNLFNSFDGYLLVLNMNKSRKKVCKRFHSSNLFVEFTHFPEMDKSLYRKTFNNVNQMKDFLFNLTNEVYKDLSNLELQLKDWG